MPDSARFPILPGRFDDSRFRRLIELAGPSMAAALLRQLDEDLGTCRRRFAAALTTSDFGGLRFSSHDLIALAGSCGAETLHDLAKSVNACAHSRLLSPILTMHDEIEAELDALLSVIRTSLDVEDIKW